MTKQLKKILAVLCLAASGTVMAATPTDPTTPLSEVPADGTITGFTLTPNEVILEDGLFARSIPGTGSCIYNMKWNGIAYATPTKVGLPYNFGMQGVFEYFADSMKTVNEKVFTAEIIPVPPCKISAGARSLTASIKVTRKVPLANTVIPLTPVIANIPFKASCPAPYFYQTGGVDGGKGEFYCKKADPICPDGWSGSVHPNTGLLVCTSVAQPTIACPKSTKDWKWGAVWYKESWNKMGCKAALQAAN